MQVKIIKDSLNTTTGNRLTTYQLYFPKCLLAELNAHRILSRNAGSSRARPSRRMRSSANFQPSVWLENKPGMQGESELTGLKLSIAKLSWFIHHNSSLFCNWLAGDVACLHKQYANRMLETHAYVDVVVSGTTWDNFFLLRTHDTTQPEFRAIALEMKRLYDVSIPSPIAPGEWHLPYVKSDEYSDKIDQITSAIARCARVSYNAFDSDKPTTLESDKKLCEKLFGSSPKHLSPAEHVAIALSQPEQHGNFTGFKQYRKFIVGEDGINQSQILQK